MRYILQFRGCHLCLLLDHSVIPFLCSNWIIYLSFFSVMWVTILEDGIKTHILCILKIQQRKGTKSTNQKWVKHKEHVRPDQICCWVTCESEIVVCPQAELSVTSAMSPASQTRDSHIPSLLSMPTRNHMDITVPPVPTVAPEVLRVAEHRHRNGLMFPYIYHVLTKVREAHLDW